MYYAYIRVSTTTQAEHGFGLETQRQTINDYCAKNNIVLSGKFADEGISGTYKSYASARKARDRKDLQYGANIFTIVAIK